MNNDFQKLVRQMPHLKNDPFIRQELRREERRHNAGTIRTMAQMPSRSGWITLLQNRVNRDSIGNLNHARKVYFHLPTKTVGESERYDPSTNVPFRMAMCKHGRKAEGWTEA